VVNQVTQGLQMMTGMILLCGVLILYAGVALSMPARLQQSALLRTLGSSRRTVLRIQAVEFALLGGIAGLIAAVAAELALAAIVEQLFAGGAQLHLWLWLAGPLGGAALVALLGVGYSARSVGIPPLQLLRRLN
jgi:putative ABC transport system permease protein